MLDKATSNSNNNFFSPNSKADNGKGNEPDVNILALLNKIMESIKILYDTCIKSKYTRIVKYKVLIPTVWKLEEIYTNL